MKNFNSGFYLSFSMMVFVAFFLVGFSNIFSPNLLHVGEGFYDFTKIIMLESIMPLFLSLMYLIFGFERLRANEPSNFSLVLAFIALLLWLIVLKNPISAGLMMMPQFLLWTGSCIFLLVGFFRAMREQFLVNK